MKPKTKSGSKFDKNRVIEKRHEFETRLKESLHIHFGELKNVHIGFDELFGLMNRVAVSEAFGPNAATIRLNVTKIIRALVEDRTLFQYIKPIGRTGGVWIYNRDAKYLHAKDGDGTKDRATRLRELASLRDRLCGNLIFMLDGLGGAQYTLENFVSWVPTDELKVFGNKNEQKRQVLMIVRSLAAVGRLYEQPRSGKGGALTWQVAAKTNPTVKVVETTTEQPETRGYRNFPVPDPLSFLGNMKRSLDLLIESRQKLRELESNIRAAMLDKYKAKLADVDFVRVETGPYQVALYREPTKDGGSCITMKISIVERGE